MTDHDEPELTVVANPAAVVAHLLLVGQRERARELAAEQVAAHPDDPVSYAMLASVLTAMREQEGALAAAERAVELDPEWPRAWMVLSRARFASGRFAAAEEAVLEAIRLEPDAAELFTHYAELLNACGESERALDLVRHAVELDPDDDDAHRLFALLLHDVQPSKWRLSEEVARRAIALDPDDADGFAVLGWILLRQRRHDEAEEAFSTALELQPTNDLAVSGLAHVVMRRNPFYRPFLMYALTISRLGTVAQLFVVGALWALVSVLHATVAREEPASTLVLVGYFALCAYTWFAEPILRAVLRRKYPWL